MRAEHGFLRRLMVAGVRRADVKRHGDIAAQRFLNRHAGFRTDEHLASVQMAAEMNALFLDFAQTCEREYLESAGIRQNRLVPAHELVQPASLADQLLTGADMQVVGIGEDNLRTDFVQLARGHALDRCLCADRHENRGLDVAVRRMNDASAGMGLRVLFDKVKRYG